MERSARSMLGNSRFGESHGLGRMRRLDIASQRAAMPWGERPFRAHSPACASTRRDRASCAAWTTRSSAISARLDRQRRARRFVMPLEQQLPQPVQRGERLAGLPSRTAPRAPRPTWPGSVAAPELDQRRAMDGLQQGTAAHSSGSTPRSCCRRSAASVALRIPGQGHVRTGAHRPAIGQSKHLADLHRQ
jgi:hypothetical protein